MSRPQALLARLQSLERRLGRRPSYHWGPRVIDLDILLYGGMRVNEPNLVIPHSCLAQRPFMLALLGEVFQEPRTALREGPRVL
jgi:2-amino-4-hydroxy-6-hydroxymethyldihydropteridine diphosphokinase